MNSLDDEIGGNEQSASTIRSDDGRVVPDPQLTRWRRRIPRPTWRGRGGLEHGPEPFDDRELVGAIIWRAPVLVMGVAGTLCAHLWIGPSHRACLA